MHKKLLRIFLLLIFFTSYSKEVWITVLVHGNISIKPFLCYKNIRNLMFDAVDKTEYAYAADCIRVDPFFYGVQQMQNLGLVPIQKESCKKGDACAAFAQIYDEINSLSGKTEENYYYTFGWSGLMSHTKRLEEADLFYDQLFQLIKSYQDKHIDPRIRLIGYSHGGNVCLNLAHSHKKREAEKTIDCIDQLILLGMPVQAENAAFVEDNLFKKVYHFYSIADKIQRIDFFSFKRFFSKKRFRNIHSKNLTQIGVSLIQDKKDFSPGHTELWFFGWTAFNYRKNFPLYPFSLVHILPLLLNSIEQEERKNHLMLTLYPQEEELTLTYQKNKRHKKTVTTYPFLSQENHKKLAAKALSFSPESYTIADENEHIMLALLKGKTKYQDSKFSRAL